jgi:CRISPR type III-B/RAMP module RAMP protein Cmr6
MTRVAGPLGGFVEYEPEQQRLRVRSGGRDTREPNGTLLLRRVAWTEVAAEHKEPAAAALRATAARSLLPKDLLAAARCRREAAVARLRARGHACHELRVRPVWRLVVGLGEETPSEVGMRLHGTYGAPVLPGSALKGVARAMARDDKDNYADYGRAAFGNEVGATADTAAGTAKAGTATFLDALPDPPGNAAGAIAIDVVNPHAPGYYRTAGQEPPADYQQPIPVQFLTVSSAVSFRVHVLGRRPHDDEAELAADQARDWLLAGLAELGIGAKTNAGYGYLVELAEDEQ